MCKEAPGVTQQSPDYTHRSGGYCSTINRLDDICAELQHVAHRGRRNSVVRQSLLWLLLSGLQRQVEPGGKTEVPKPGKLMKVAVLCFRLAGEPSLFSPTHPSIWKGNTWQGWSCDCFLKLLNPLVHSLVARVAIVIESQTLSNPMWLEQT